jgi:hypothetical protein
MLHHPAPGSLAVASPHFSETLNDADDVMCHRSFEDTLGPSGDTPIQEGLG